MKSCINTNVLNRLENFEMKQFAQFNEALLHENKFELHQEMQKMMQILIDFNERMEGKGYKKVKPRPSQPPKSLKSQASNIQKAQLANHSSSDKFTSIVPDEDSLQSPGLIPQHSSSGRLKKRSLQLGLMNTNLEQQVMPPVPEGYERIKSESEIE